MALKPNSIAVEKPKKAERPGAWKTTMPGRITAEDAEREPRERRLWPDA